MQSLGSIRNRYKGPLKVSTYLIILLYIFLTHFCGRLKIRANTIFKQLVRCHTYILFLWSFTKEI